MLLEYIFELIPIYKHVKFKIALSGEAGVPRKLCCLYCTALNALNLNWFVIFLHYWYDNKI